MNPYVGRRVLVTGGLGFLGSNLTIRLVQLGAAVTVVDSSVIGCGANHNNIESVADRVELIDADIAEVSQFRHALKRAEVVFNLAGEISHSHSMQFPERDLALNTHSQLSFVQECARSAPGIRIVYAGTRQVYGKPEYLPVDEAHPVAPVDFNGIHKHAACLYHLTLTREDLIDAVVLRLTNIYGPRLAINVPCQGVLSNFFLNALSCEPIQVFGEGNQLRDPLYVDDAVTALLLAGAQKRLESRVYNVGGNEPLTMAAIARTVCRIAGAPAPVFRPFPPDRARIEIGSFVSDSTLIRDELGWVPTTSFEDGTAETLRFFRRNLLDYLDPSGSSPTCLLRQPHAIRRNIASA